MAWVTVPGLKGLVYVPDDAGRLSKKHPCSTCYACQWCDETRCRVCRSEGLDAVDPDCKHGCGRE